MTWSLGANYQQDRGCKGNAFNVALYNNTAYYYVQIWVTNDCAEGTGGCIYGCNGNVRLAVNGYEIGHVADCAAPYTGITGIATYLEPLDEYDSTPELATSYYATYSAMDFIEALLYIGDTASWSYAYPNALTEICQATPPPGAGSIIFTNTDAEQTTTGGNCPPGTVYLASPPAGAARPAASAPSLPAAAAANRAVGGLPPEPTLRGTIPTSPTPVSVRYGPSGTPLPHRRPVFPGSQLPPPKGASGTPYKSVPPLSPAQSSAAGLGGAGSSAPPTATPTPARAR
jgi:hypothetical protein